MNSWPVTVKMHSFFDCSSNFSYPWAQSKSNFVIIVSSSVSSDIFRFIHDISSSMFGICVFRFIVASFSFFESNALFIDLCFFTVITAGLTKQSSVISVALSRYLFFINLFISSAISFCRWIGIGLSFCCIIFAISFKLILTTVSFISVLL